MLRIVKKIIIIAVVLILMLGINNITSVMAATTTLTASNTSVKSGETFSVTVKSSVKLTGWTISLSDKGGCTFSSASGGEVNGSTVYGTDLSGKTSLATYTFKAPSVTKDTKYTIKFSGSAMCDVDTNEINNTSCTATITVKADTNVTNKNTSTTNKTDNTDKTTTTNKDTTTNTEKPKEKSSNAYLSTLGVTPKEYDFSDFSKTKTTYNVTVPSDVDSLKVLYKTADANAKVKVSGNSGFEVGSNNKITIKVTAEDGKTTKTYTIKVTKLAEDEEKPGNLIEDEKGLYLTSLNVGGLELSPEFVKDTYSYTAKLVDSAVTELNVEAKANNEKAKVEISGNTELVEGENTINVVLTLEGSSTKTVYQIIVTKEAEAVTETPVTTIGNTPTASSDLIGSIKKYAVIAIAIVVLMIVTVIVLIILLRRENKRLKEDDEEDDYNDINETQKDEYNVYKNDINEFESNNVEKDNFIESLYKQRNGEYEEDLDEQEKETLEEISKQTAKIFEEKTIEGQSVEYSKSDFYEENPLEVRRKRRGKGKHSK